MQSGTAKTREGQRDYTGAAARARALDGVDLSATKQPSHPALSQQGRAVAIAERDAFPIGFEPKSRRRAASSYADNFAFRPASLDRTKLDLLRL